MSFLSDLRPRVQDWAMGRMNDLRPPTLDLAEGEVLEIGFGTGLNLAYYPGRVRSLAAVDPFDGLNQRVQERIAEAPFPVERFAVRADSRLPFDDGRFDCIVTTWTMCSIRHPLEALLQMRRVLKPGGRYLFVEHGRSDDHRTSGWQDRLNPFWCCLMDGCNINRPIDLLVQEGGFEITEIERFLGQGPRVFAEMYGGGACRV
jgi:SAM-dependent methyltransferase